MNLLALANSPFAPVKADRTAGVIYGVSVITAGIEAHGHNAPAFVTDGVLLHQVADSINAQPNGVRCRMGHAEAVGAGDGLHVLVGKIRNARVDGGAVRADFYAGKGANPGDIDRLFWLAEDAPEDAGLSIIPKDYHFVEEGGELHLRVNSIFSVDWVGVPAANPVGMLSKNTQGKTPGKAIAMKLNQAQIAFLRTIGLAETATEDEYGPFVEKLTPEMKAKFAEIPVEEMPACAAPVAQPAAAAQPVAASDSKPAAPALASPDHKATLTEINEIAALAGLPGEWVVQMSLEGKTPTEARKLALQKKAKGATVPDVIIVGEDQNRASLRQAIPDAIMLRAGYRVKNAHERSNKLAGLTVLDMARHHFAALGVRDAFELPRVEICNLISKRYFSNKYPALAGGFGAQGSSGFDNILADTINKSLLTSYGEAPSSWSKWAKRGTTPDFKLTRRVGTFDMPTLTERKEGQGLNYVTIDDRGESFYMKEYHGGVAITRVALVNDDLGALSDITRKMGKAARNIEDDAAYAQLGGVGRTMADTGALFNATAQTTAGGHTNYTSSGTAISTTSLGVGFGQMFVQKGVATGAKWSSGTALEIRPKYLIVASQIEYIARQAISSTELLTSEALTSAGIMKGTSNPFKDTVEVIPTTRLVTSYGGTTASSTAWILAADPNEIDTVEVTFLQGEEQPVLSQETDFDTDDMRFKVRHACVATALDFRGLYKNVGA